MLKINYATGGSKNFECETCQQALLILKREKLNDQIESAIFRDIDINMSLNLLHHIASEYLRHDNNVPLGNRYLELIKLKSIRVN